MATYKSNRTEAEERISRLVHRELVTIANIYERDLQDQMREPKTGRVYGRRRHRASAPGEAPAIDFAHLRKGIKHTITKLGRMNWRLAIGVTEQSGRAEVAKHLEFGTSRIEARPMWRPALQRLRALLRKTR